MDIITSGPFQGLKRNGYKILMADPPWHFHAWSHRGEKKGAIQHYETMTIKDICDLPVHDLVTEDAALFLWVVQPMLYPEANDVIKAWGFNYRTIAFVWVKMKKSWTPASPEHEPRLGLGYHTRSGAELCLLAIKGKGYNRVEQGIPQVLHAPLRNHSQKPNEIASRIDRLVGDVPKLELFAPLEPHPGWERWGNKSVNYEERELQKTLE